MSAADCALVWTVTVMLDGQRHRWGRLAVSADAARRGLLEQASRCPMLAGLKVLSVRLARNQRLIRA